MTWSTSEIEYEGFPLLLRKPDHFNIGLFRDRFTRLVTIVHSLEKVSSDGLPDRNYNNTLKDFDHYMCSLLEGTNDGIIFLIETFAGKRNYYYYTLPLFDINPLIERGKKIFKVSLQVTVKEDFGWGFLKEYPVQLFI